MLLSRCTGETQSNATMSINRLRLYEDQPQPQPPDDNEIFFAVNAEQAALRNLADSLNTAFRGTINAKWAGDEIVIECGRKTAWIGTDGELTGEASNPPLSDP